MTATSPPRKQLSSDLTFLHKIVFPAIWLGGFGAATVAAIIWPTHDGPAPASFAIALVAGAVFLYRWGVTLKKVTATEGGILVSNFRREVLVPYEEISGVRENKLMHPHPITVELRSPSAFGRSFVFIPSTWSPVFGDHPTAQRLWERAEAARRGPPSR